MYYSAIHFNDIANGYGVRTSLFVSGCRNHCRGCFQPETWDFRHGSPFTKETADLIIDQSRPDWINGLSLLGGDPFEIENQMGLMPFLERFREELPQKDIWCYTGYTLEDICNGRLDGYGLKMLALIDVLVDGPFVEEEKDISLRFRGSRNQRIIDLKNTREQSNGCYNRGLVLWDAF